ncbi:MAG: ABC transporter permease [Calditrichaeota bacterium]|nr:ABC transporter permease [Calditrichota bacterium]
MRRPRSRIAAIALKEFWHILHDPRSLTIIFLLPVIQLIMFGYALNLEIQKVELAIIDLDRTPASRELIQHFEGSPFFEVMAFRAPISQIETLFLRRKARAVLIIPADYSRQRQQGTTVDLQLIIDASDPNAAINISNYCQQIVEAVPTTRLAPPPAPFEVKSTIWFNPDMKSAYFFVPGLLALLLVMISALLTSVAITREKETGTLEQLLVSPVTPVEIILGKVIPYVLLAFLDGVGILLIGVFVFQVPFTGSAVLLAFLTLLYIITALSLGLMISTVTSTQQVAMMAAQSATLLPTLFLSGFIFPLRSLPWILQLISYIVPARYYLVIVRGIMLKGNTLPQLITPALFLMGLSTVLLIIAGKRFKTTLEA